MRTEKAKVIRKQLTELRIINQTIQRHIDEFENGVDILDLKTKPCQGYVLENNLFTKAQNILRNL